MYPIIQPDLLTTNQQFPVMGMRVGDIYEAVNPFGLPGPFLVMHIQAAEAITSRGYILRQEFSILASEGALSATEGTVSTITDADHGIGDAFIPGEVGTHLEIYDNDGYFAWVDDATAAAPEIVRVAKNSTEVFTLADGSAFADAVATDAYTIFKPGRMKVAALNETLPPWGVSCAALTDEYYGFMVVKGWYHIAMSASGVNSAAGGGIVVSGTAGLGEGNTAGTDDVAVIAQAGHVATGTEFIPCYVKGFCA